MNILKILKQDVQCRLDIYQKQDKYEEIINDLLKDNYKQTKIMNDFNICSFILKVFNLKL